MAKSSTQFLHPSRTTEVTNYRTTERLSRYAITCVRPGGIFSNQKFHVVLVSDLDLPILHSPFSPSLPIIPVRRSLQPFIPDGLEVLDLPPWLFRRRRRADPALSSAPARLSHQACQSFLLRPALLWSDVREVRGAISSPVVVE